MLYQNSETAFGHLDQYSALNILKGGGGGGGGESQGFPPNETLMIIYDISSIIANLNVVSELPYIPLMLIVSGRLGGGGEGEVSGVVSPPPPPTHTKTLLAVARLCMVCNCL